MCSKQVVVSNKCQDRESRIISYRSAVQLGWVFTCITNGQQPKEMVKGVQQSVYQSSQSCFNSSRVGLIASICPKVCSTLWAQVSSNVFINPSLCNLYSRSNTIASSGPLIISILVIFIRVNQTTRPKRSSFTFTARPKTSSKIHSYSRRDAFLSFTQLIRSHYCSAQVYRKNSATHTCQT